METNFNQNQEEFELNQIAVKKVAKLKSFYKHLFLYLIGLTIYLLKEYTELPLNISILRFINGVVVIIWTAVILGSAIDLFVSFRVFGKEWEQRKLRSILERKHQKQKWE
ncbi:2TM domain-containing protein [Flavobacterium ginsengiterrae]|uniref:2TM domain-containing protein n=1 Tax=Flavobacterium ginsengiterrae TaxID=871695 RepID=A0ABP7GX32_9FLAO